MGAARAVRPLAGTLPRAVGLTGANGVPGHWPVQNDPTSVPSTMTATSASSGPTMPTITMPP